MGNPQPICKLERMEENPVKFLPFVVLIFINFYLAKVNPIGFDLPWKERRDLQLFLSDFKNLFLVRKRI